MLPRPKVSSAAFGRDCEAEGRVATLSAPQQAVEMAQQPVPLTHLMLCTVEVTGQTCWGDTLVLCGADPTLGSWEPQKAARMETNEHCYPVWQVCDVPLRCTGHETELEFKIVKLKAPINGTRETEWEPVAQNRRLPLLPGRRVRISLTWGESSNEPLACVDAAQAEPSKPITRSASAPRPPPPPASPASSQILHAQHKTSPSQSLHHESFDSVRAQALLNSAGALAPSQRAQPNVQPPARDGPPSAALCQQSSPAQPPPLSPSQARRLQEQQPPQQQPPPQQPQPPQPQQQPQQQPPHQQQQQRPAPPVVYSNGVPLMSSHAFMLAARQQQAQQQAAYRQAQQQAQQQQQAAQQALWAQQQQQQQAQQGQQQGQQGQLQAATVRFSAGDVQAHRRNQPLDTIQSMDLSWPPSLSPSEHSGLNSLGSSQCASTHDSRTPSSMDLQHAPSGAPAGAPLEQMLS